MSTISKEKCTLKTADGPICGFVDKTGDRSYYRFKGIPYAKPPLGSLRFLPPVPVQPWHDIRECTEDPPIPMCNDYPTITDTAQKSEDCLYIEVTSPNIKPNKPLPVMFWIGGYSFACYFDHILDHTVLVDKNIVFVRCGYRLGPFGFLSINDYTAPGNCGLKDLVMALKWIQRNISAFGGDPDNVTIFGNSSGGAIVHFMMLSPMATGLFHRAIIQSASALNNWSLTKNPSPAVMELANMLGIKAATKIEMVEKLRSVPATEIQKAFQKMSEEYMKLPNNDIIDAIFKPCIELDLEGQPAFITKSPPLLMKSGNFNKVPLIIGSNNIEGAVLQFIKEDFYDDFEKINQNVCLLVPRSLAGRDKLSKNIGHQLLKFYLGGDEQLRKDTRTQYLQLITDYYFSYYVNKTVRLHSQFAPECKIYYFIVNYAGEWSVPKHLEFFNSLGHCAELPFIFGIKSPDTCKGSRDSVKTRCRMVKMWTNFAKTGNPTPDPDDSTLQIVWDPVENNNKLNYLNIGMELTKGRNPFLERMKLWDELHEEHTFLRTLVYFNDMGVSWLKSVISRNGVIGISASKLYTGYIAEMNPFLPHLAFIYF